MLVLSEPQEKQTADPCTTCPKGQVVGVKEDACTLSVRAVADAESCIPAWAGADADNAMQKRFYLRPSAVICVHLRLAL